MGPLSFRQMTGGKTLFTESNLMMSIRLSNGFGKLSISLNKINSGSFSNSQLDQQGCRLKVSKD